ncbi:PBIP1 protein, partial [Caloenas nicobarica]|nr:PBIP1 protein [Caloenas nicobarica]
EPGVTDDGEHEEPDAEAEPSPCPDTPKAGGTPTGDQPGEGVRGGDHHRRSPCPSPGPPTEEGSGSSSDDDVEGLLRRWQSHEPPLGPPRPAPAPHRGTPGDGDGLGVSKLLLGAVALVALGLLVISGPVESVVSRDVAAGEQESPLLADGNDSQQNPPPSDTGDPPSVQSVTQLLDKLAKENQEIRLLQAELQAQKDELQTLLRRSEGDAAAAEAQQRGLVAENARLRAALERDAAALRDARAELQRLRAGGAPGGTGWASSSSGEPAAEPTARRHSAGRLAVVRQELAG